MFADKKLKEVELELEREEKEATANGTAVVHECTPSSMVKLGLDIQCTQYARLSLSGYWVI